MPLVAECVEIAGRVGPRWSAAREACDGILRTLDLEPARADRADLELVPRRQTGIAKDLGRMVIWCLLEILLTLYLSA